MTKLFLYGLKDVWRQKKVILLFWLVNLFIGTLFSFPYLVHFSRFFANRTISSLLTHYHIYTYFAEFRYWMSDSLGFSYSFLRIGGIVHLFLTLLFSGGIIAAFWSGKFPGMRQFFRESWFYVWAMVKIGLISLVILLSTVVSVVLIGLPVMYFLPEPFVENVYFYVYFLWASVGFICFLFATLLIDIIKILTVRLKTTKVMRSLKEFAGLISIKTFRIVIMYMFLYILMFLLVLIYWKISSITGGSSWIAMVLDLLFLQVLIFLLIWIRLSRYPIVISWLKMSDFRTGS